MTDTTLLLRQIHPTWHQQGRVTSQAFRPTPKDEDKLSAYDGDLIEAKPAWEHYTTVQKKESIGVLAVTVAECSALKLTAASSPKVFKEHCHIDFSGLKPKEIERKGKLLRDHAVKRDWLYRATA